MKQIRNVNKWYKNTAFSCLSCNLNNSMCAICLSDFKSCDLIVRSNNKNCVHSFHKKCVMPWLLKSRVCPVCRRFFLVPKTCANLCTIVVEESASESNTGNELEDVRDGE